MGALRLAELADALGLEFEGDPNLELSALASLDDATPADLSFVTGERYRRGFDASKGGAFLALPDFDTGGRPCLRSPLPYRDFARAVELFHPSRRLAPGIHATAVVADDAVLGTDVSIGPYAVIGAAARVGDRTVIHAHATLYPDVVVGAECEIHSGAHLRAGVRLGDRVDVQSGAVIGSEGFGFVFAADGRRVRVPHRCPVEIGDDSYIGANTTIDASHPGHSRHGHAETRTRIGRNVMIDNQVQVGHGVCLEDGVTLCAQVGLSGSTTVGRGVYMAGRASTAGHLRIGEGSLVGGNTGLIGDLDPGSQVVGYVAMERRRFFRSWSLFTRLPELARRLRRAEKKLGIDEKE